MGKVSLKLLNNPQQKIIQETHDRFGICRGDDGGDEEEPCDNPDGCEPEPCDDPDGCEPEPEKEVCDEDMMAVSNRTYS